MAASTELMVDVFSRIGSSFFTDLVNTKSWEGQSSVQGLKLLNVVTTSISQSPRFAIFQECREIINSVIRSMWIRNHLVDWQRSCSHENTSRIKESWEGRREVKDDASCEACKLAKEVSLFWEMLRGGH
ncbi:hypothetical protein Vadar_028726 [Vaccinium darrowii]|uniref:Uncharacterized protein n=1 Tax=Vaccinium darrowii TaxID=229202 RepID=A0ACB7YH55_9ERIC|nr:hypothetical protein Vadar_028726 [Vaccinium darrowii]